MRALTITAWDQFQLSPLLKFSPDSARDAAKRRVTCSAAESDTRGAGHASRPLLSVVGRPCFNTAIHKREKKPFKALYQSVNFITHSLTHSLNQSINRLFFKTVSNTHAHTHTKHLTRQKILGKEREAERGERSRVLQRLKGQMSKHMCTYMT